MEYNERRQGGVMRQTYTLSNIVDAHAQKRNFEKQFPLSRFVVRPLSFLSAYLLLKITRSPSRVAVVGLLVGLAGCLSFVMLGEWTPWPGVALLLLYDLLDASDGVVARTTGNVTYYGRFLDGVIGEIVEGVYCVSLGTGLYRAGEEAARITILGGQTEARIVMLAAGAAIMCGRLYSSHVAGSYYHYLEKRAPAAEESVTQEIETSRYRHNWGYLTYVNVASFDVQLVVLLLCAVLGALDLHLYLYALCYLLQSVLYTFFYVSRARTTLSR